MEIQTRNCRVCGGSLDTVLDLGVLVLLGFPLPTDPPGAVAPLDFCQCARCGLVQLRHTVDPDLLFRQYWYLSGINETMRAELADVAASAITHVGGLSHGDLVIDIGANDGTLLSTIPKETLRIAFEPALNLNDACHEHAQVVIADYFPRGLTDLGATPRAKLIFSIACFYDLDDPGSFVQAIRQRLAPDGAWIVQFQDLHQMIQATAFDNIVIEHLITYSLGSFERLIAPYGLRVTHAETRTINGGSYRMIVQHDSVQPDASVAALRQFESGCEHWHTLEKFAWRVGESKRQILGAVDAMIAQGRTLDLYGASTKSNTLLQFCGIGPDRIRQAWERSPAKIGRATSTGIPIVDEATGRANPPDLLFAGIWQFRDAILNREADFIEQGGRFLFPLPEVDLVEGGR